MNQIFVKLIRLNSISEMTQLNSIPKVQSQVKLIEITDEAKHLQTSKLKFELVTTIASTQLYMNNVRC